ncbi:TetR/AcrR family transcriptional regulator [Paramicrobacterium chengjingii]|uniref:TetR/AcrR family transcriptional regulator n=1 Tax=Paramicrobacterium chengjingii TaxID=2769067 RepID=UPI00141D9D19|nr:TetR/AcrR family transcriptional regulator [Microbacterium chengjingii]
MGRAAKFTDQNILDAALDIIAQDGALAATGTAIAKRLGAPSGSIYHRFASRDLILATLWIRTIKRFQRGFLEAISQADSREAAELAVAHTLEWTAAHRNEAIVLAMYRREDLMASWPEELGGELATLNDDVKIAVRDFTTAHFGAANAETLGKASFALVELPYSAVRHMLRRNARPEWLADAVTAASLAALDAGESASGHRPH